MNIILDNGKIKVVINSKGAEIKSLRYNDIEYIWCSDPKYWNRSAPVLFPIVGTLKDKKTIIKKKEYRIPQHGVLRDQEMELVESDNKHCVFKVTESDETLKVYPYKYTVEISFILDDLKVESRIKVYNSNDEILPFNIGLHPAFNVPLFDNEKFDDYSIHYEKKETFLSPKVMSNATLNFNEPVLKYENIDILNLEKRLFDIDTIIIPNVKSRSVKLLNKHNEGVKLCFPDFTTLATWTPFNDAPFVCIEPWIGYNDHFDSNGEFITKDDLINLKPNESFITKYYIEIVSK